MFSDLTNFAKYTYTDCECSKNKYTKVPGKTSVQVTEEMLNKFKKYLKWKYFDNFVHEPNTIITALSDGSEQKVSYTFFIDDLKYKIRRSLQDSLWYTSFTNLIKLTEYVYKILENRNLELKEKNENLEMSLFEYAKKSFYCYNNDKNLKDKIKVSQEAPF